MMKNKLNAFEITDGQIKKIAAAFCEELNAKTPVYVQNLPSYLPLPNGKECGDFLALDFGGTNIRVSLVRLLGDGESKILAQEKKPLRCENYNVISAQATAENLFDFIADCLQDFLKKFGEQKNYELGHTFSFGTRQKNARDAQLIRWAKEIQTQGVEGQWVNALLKNSLQKKEIKNIFPKAILNDTVAVLLAGAYREKNLKTSAIYATGFNTCFFDGEMILNVESGNFRVPFCENEFDDELNQNSSQPNRQRLEKMVSGRYLGELYSLAMKREKIVTSEELSKLALAGDELAQKILIRSAKIVAGIFLGTFLKLREKNLSIAIEGALYENVPLIGRTLDEIFEKNGVRAKRITVHNGASIGAAVACCLS